MAPKTERIKVEVTDSIEGESRKFGITLTAPNVDFQLADLLRQRGVISPLDSELKDAVKAATDSYLSGAEVLISTLSKVSTAGPKSSPNGKRKARHAGLVSPSSDSGSERQQERVGDTN